MSFGLDYVHGPPVTDLKSAGVTFVCRYLSEVNDLTKIKLLTHDEAKTLSEAGIAVVSNYEWYANRALQDYAAGFHDAQVAASQHAACGGPANRPIYFSVDCDCAGSQVAEYFRGVVSVLGLARTGAYGSYRVLNYLFNQGFISWGWQTYAWSAGQWDARVHIQQYQNSMTLAGASVDYNRSMKSDFGQWIQGGTTMSSIPAGWHDDGQTLTAPNGHKVVFGFRAHVLRNNWDPANLPVEEEWHANPLEYSNPSLGDGQKQCFTWTTLEYIPARGVFEAYQGQEIHALLAQLTQAQKPAINPDIVVQVQAASTALSKALTDLNS